MVAEILTADNPVCVNCIDRLSLLLYKSDDEDDDEDDDSEEETTTNIVMVSFSKESSKRGIFFFQDKILGPHSKRRKPVLENCVCAPFRLWRC